VYFPKNAVAPGLTEHHLLAPLATTESAGTAMAAQLGCRDLACLRRVGAKASLEQIARRAGISRSLINYHFAGRDELMAQVLRTVRAEGGRFLSDALAAADGPRAELAAFIRGNLAIITARRTHMAALYAIVISGPNDSGSTEPEHDITEPRAELLRDILVRGQAEGAFRDFDPPAMTTAVIQAIEGALSWAPGDPISSSYFQLRPERGRSTWARSTSIAVRNSTAHSVVSASTVMLTWSTRDRTFRSSLANAASSPNFVTVSVVAARSSWKSVSRRCRV
jgi:AcrR family transcriptional regulator